MSNWMKHTPEYPHLTSVFVEYGVNNLLAGDFMKAMTSLCGFSPHVFGSWIDILGIKNREIQHSW